MGLLPFDGSNGQNPQPDSAPTPPPVVSESQVVQDWLKQGARPKKATARAPLNIKGLVLKPNDTAIYQDVLELDGVGNIDTHPSYPNLCMHA